MLDNMCLLLWTRIITCGLLGVLILVAQELVRLGMALAHWVDWVSATDCHCCAEIIISQSVWSLIHNRYLLELLFPDSFPALILSNISFPSVNRS